MRIPINDIKYGKYLMDELITRGRRSRREKLYLDEISDNFEEDFDSFNLTVPRSLRNFLKNIPDNILSQEEFLTLHSLIYSNDKNDWKIAYYIIKNK